MDINNQPQTKFLARFKQKNQERQQEKSNPKTGSPGKKKGDK